MAVLEEFLEIVSAFVHRQKTLVDSEAAVVCAKREQKRLVFLKVRNFIADWNIYFLCFHLKVLATLLPDRDNFQVDLPWKY